VPGRKDQHFVQGHGNSRATAFLAPVTASVVDEDASHELCGYAKEMGPTLPICCLLANKLEICLMNQSSGLESVALPLAAHVTPSKSLQLVVNQGHEPFGCCLVSLRQLRKQERHIRLLGIHI
jgi:hypothetical protein